MRDDGLVGSYIEVQVTCGSQGEADAVADSLVEQRLAACVQQMPIRSTFRWEGAVEHDDEILLFIKTRADLADAVRDHVLSVHSYDVPAMTWVEIAGGSPDYLSWIDDETTPPP